MELDDEHLAQRAGSCRCRTAESATIAFGGKALECEVLGLSPDGAAVCLRSLAHVPDLVVLRLPGGGTRAMRCIWQNGPHVGLMTAGSSSSIAPAQ